MPVPFGTRTVAIRAKKLDGENSDLRVPSNTPGFRDAGNNKGYGALREVGSAGYSWSSTVSGSNVRFLGFYYYGVNPQDYNHRAHGLPLRCLQEERR